MTRLKTLWLSSVVPVSLFLTLNQPQNIWGASLWPLSPCPLLFHHNAHCVICRSNFLSCAPVILSTYSFPITQCLEQSGGSLKIWYIEKEKKKIGKKSQMEVHPSPESCLCYSLCCEGVSPSPCQLIFHLAFWPAHAPQWSCSWSPLCFRGFCLLLLCSACYIGPWVTAMHEWSFTTLWKLREGSDRVLLILKGPSSGRSLCIGGIH